MQTALDNLLRESSRTTVIVAHRLSTIRNADNIAVIDKGSIIEFGNHNTLMNKSNGFYRSLVESQYCENKQLPPHALSMKVLQDDSHECMNHHLKFDNVTFAYPSR